jgi:hypothetical protein
MGHTLRASNRPGIAITHPRRSVSRHPTRCCARRTLPRSPCSRCEGGRRSRDITTTLPTVHAPAGTPSCTHTGGVLRIHERCLTHHLCACAVHCHYTLAASCPLVHTPLPTAGRPPRLVIRPADPHRSVSESSAPEERERNQCRRLASAPPPVALSAVCPRPPPARARHGSVERMHRTSCSARELSREKLCGSKPTQRSKHELPAPRHAWKCM